METNSATERKFLVDLEKGTDAVVDEQEEARSGDRHANRLLKKVWSGIVGIDGLARGGEAVKSVNSMPSPIDLPTFSEGEALQADKRFRGEEKAGVLEKKVGAERTDKKSCKKPPKPPRPPRSPSLDAPDLKLMKELAELAELKRARIERMKKRMKKAKPTSTSSNSNLCALVVTILFCLVIIWQGVFSRGGSSVKFHGSPEASVQTRGGFISIQFYKNVSKKLPDLSSSASPSNMEPVAGRDADSKVIKAGR